MAKPRFRLFLIEVEGFEAHVTTAPTAGKARWDAFSRLREAYQDVTFREFLAKSRVTPHHVPADDGYDYVRRNYGVDVRVGQRVRLVNEGSSSGLEGEVLYPGPSTAHVRVALDGRDHASLVHPLSVEAA